MDYQWHDLVGNAGVIAILATYALVQLDRLEVRDFSYSALNALGAALILVSLAFDFNLSSFVIEIVWLVISVYAIVRRGLMNNA
jgi:hypothetical protein